MRILVTSDGSERSLHALPHAREMARGLGGELQLLRVVSSTDQSEIASRHQYLEGISEQYGLDARIHVEPQQDGENVASTILRVRQSTESDVIAMDTRGSGALRHALFGSVAMDILHNAAVPVLATGPTIGEPVAADPYHILVAADESAAAEELSDVIANLVAGTPARITVIQVIEPRLGDPGEDQLIRVARQHVASLASQFPAGTDVTERVETTRGLKSAGETLHALAAEVGANTIAVASKGASRARHLLLGSTGLDIVGHGQIPVLLVRAG